MEYMNDLCIRTIYICRWNLWTKNECRCATINIRYPIWAVHFFVQCAKLRPIHQFELWRAVFVSMSPPSHHLLTNSSVFSLEFRPNHSVFAQMTRRSDSIIASARKVLSLMCAGEPKTQALPVIRLCVCDRGRGGSTHGKKIDSSVAGGTATNPNR